MKFAILSSAVLAASANNDGMAGDCAVVGVRTDTIDDKTHFSIVTMRDYDEGDILYATDAGVGKDRWWSYVATDLAATPNYMHYYEEGGERFKCKEFEYWNAHCFVRENDSDTWHYLRHNMDTWWGHFYNGWAYGELRERKYGDVFDNTKIKEAQLFKSTAEEFYGNKGGKRVITEEEFTSFEGFGRYQFTRPTLKGKIITSEDFQASMLAHDPPIDSWNHPDQERESWIANLELSNKGDNLFIFTADDAKMPVITKTRQEFGQHESCGYRNYCVRQRRGSCREWAQRLRECNHDVSYTVVHPTNKESFDDYNFICGATTSQHGFDDTRWVTAKDMEDVLTHWSRNYWWQQWQAKYTTLTGHQVDPGNPDDLTKLMQDKNTGGEDWTTEELEEIIEFFHNKQTEDLHLHSTSLPVPLIEGETAVDLRAPQTSSDNGHRDNWKYVGTALDGTRDEILRKLNKAPYDGGLWEFTNNANAARSYTDDIKNLFDRDAGHFYIRNPINCQESSTEYTQCVTNTGEQCGSGFKTRVIVQDASGGGLGCPQERFSCSLGPCETPEPTNSPTDSPTDAPTQFCDPSNCLNWECEDWCKCYNEELVDEYEANNCHDDNDANSCICFEGEDVSDNQHRLKKMKKA